MAKKQHEPEHIIVQLRKVVNTHGHSNVRFATGTKTDVSIDEAQQVMAQYNDAMPAVKSQIQAFVSESHDNLKLVAAHKWTPTIEVDRVRERPLFNTDQIFADEQQDVRVNRRIIKKPSVT